MNLTDSATVTGQGGLLREALIGASRLVSCVETDIETGEVLDRKSVV